MNKFMSWTPVEQAIKQSIAPSQGSLIWHRRQHLIHHSLGGCPNDTTLQSTEVQKISRHFKICQDFAIPHIDMYVYIYIYWYWYWYWCRNAQPGMPSSPANRWPCSPASRFFHEKFEQQKRLWKAPLLDLYRFVKCMMISWLSYDYHMISWYHSIPYHCSGINCTSSSYRSWIPAQTWELHRWWRRRSKSPSRALPRSGQHVLQSEQPLCALLCSSYSIFWTVRKVAVRTRKVGGQRAIQAGF